MREPRALSTRMTVFIGKKAVRDGIYVLNMSTWQHLHAIFDTGHGRKKAQRRGCACMASTSVGSEYSPAADSRRTARNVLE